MIVSKRAFNPNFPEGNPCMNCTKIDECPERSPNVTNCTGQKKKEVKK